CDMHMRPETIRSGQRVPLVTRASGGRIPPRSKYHYGRLCIASIDGPERATTLDTRAWDVEAELDYVNWSAFLGGTLVLAGAFPFRHLRKGSAYWYNRDGSVDHPNVWLAENQATSAWIIIPGRDAETKPTLRAVLFDGDGAYFKEDEE